MNTYRNIANGPAHRSIVCLSALAAITATGCGPSYFQLRQHGQVAVIRGDFGPAVIFFAQAEEKKPREVDNLHDLGVCHVILAKQKFEQLNRAAAMRELDQAIAYYRRAIDVKPSHQASLEGLNVALELKGQFEEALKHVEWTAEFVGPSAKQQIFLARELDERGDADGALLRFRQAVAMEPRNPTAHLELAKFLLRNNNEPGAVHHLQAAYRLNPSDPWVLDQLARRSAVPQLAVQSPPTP